MRLIDADEFKRTNERLLDCDFPYKSEETLGELIDDAPTVDAVEVVRCKNCIHRPIITLWACREYIDAPKDSFRWGDWTCPMLCEDDETYSYMPDDDFWCKYGDRK